MAESYRTVVATSDIAVGYWSGLATVVWMGTTYPHHAASVKAAVDAAQATSTSGTVWLLQLVAPKAVVPDGRSRSALASMLHSFDGVVSHSAVVHVGAGFRASIIRSIVTGLNALGRQKFPHKVFAETDEAMEWFSRNGLENQATVLRNLKAFHQAALAGSLQPVQSKLAVGAR